MIAMSSTDMIEGEDERWIVLVCSECFGLFDVPKRRGAGLLRSKCDDCLPPKERNRRRRRQAARLRIAG